jgi:alkaline phosphatase
MVIIKRFTTNCCLLLCSAAWAAATVAHAEDDFVRELQTEAILKKESPLGHWGPDPRVYAGWQQHSNRLIPVYTFGTRDAGKGVDLRDYTGVNSAYRSKQRLRAIYKRDPDDTFNPEAAYLDQTDLAKLQRAALDAGKKHIFLMIFDGMDWQTTWAAATFNRREVAYRSGRGTGTHFQDYVAGRTTQYGFMVTSPHNHGTKPDKNLQTVPNRGTKWGGYNFLKGGPDPWTPGDDPSYPKGRPEVLTEHAVTDSAASATAMCSGVKTYNDAINVDHTGEPVSTIANDAQEKRGMSIGVVTSVPISHATPACAYAHNVHRDDFQDLTRDLLGIPPLPNSPPRRPQLGVDVLIGGGYRDDEPNAEKGREKQGNNFEAGNKWITADDLHNIDERNGGKYVVAARTAGVDGAVYLAAQARRAARAGKRLFGFYGIDAGNAEYNGHIPYQTADGKGDPAIGFKVKPERSENSDRNENPTLADMTAAALIVLETNPKGFWLMVEAGDVDWANHDNNIDNAIGAVNSGDAAVRIVTNWVEKNGGWEKSLLIVTADHGHYFIVERPELLTGK